MKINIVILNYNGRKLLEECLPSIVEASLKSGLNPKITVLDNCSNDDSISFLKINFPQVNICIAEENKVYCSYNDFFRKSVDDIIVILNSDIKVDKYFLPPLMEHFEKDDKVLFVSSKMYFFDGVTYQGDRSIAKLHFGIISADTRFKGYEKLIEKTGYSFSTGNGAFDRKKFLELGGFDEIYLPGRYEDVDLCFRAWKFGYKGIYEPKSIIYHKGYESFKAVFTNGEIQGMVFRNSIFFMLKNITDRWLLTKFYFWLIPRLTFFLLTGKFYLFKSFWQALIRLPEVKRSKNSFLTTTFKLSDRQVLDLVSLK